MLVKKIRTSFLTLILVLFFSAQGFAGTNDVPIIGGFYNTSLIIKEEIVSTIRLTHAASIDAAVFTIGGLTLDAYVLTLPLETAVKKRVIERISNPFYAIKLGHFLYMFKDRYTGAEGITNFKSYIRKVYEKDESNGMEHSLFQWGEAEEKKEKSTVETDSESGLELNRDLIATFVTIYDAIYGKESIILKDKIPDHYSYLQNNSKDMEMVNTIQPLIVELLEKLVKSLEPGDIKDAVQIIINE